MAHASDPPTEATSWSLPAHQARSRATRERLLQAGERVFALHGFEGARLVDIAEEAGCSVGAVYFRFKDKDALFFAIAQSLVEETRAGLAERLAVPGSKTSAEIIRLFVTEMARIFAEHRGVFRAMIERGLARQGEPARTVFELRDELADRLAAALGRPAGDLPVRTMTQMVYGFLVAGVLGPQAPTSLADPATIRELVRACSAYLMGHAGPEVNVGGVG